MAPFPIKTITDALLFHARELPPRPRAIRPDLPEPLEQVILRALEKEPGKRYPSAAGLETALAGALGDSTEIVDPAGKQDVSLATAYTMALLTSEEMDAPSVMEEPDLGETDRQPALVPGPAGISPKLSFQVVSLDGKPQLYTLSADTVTIGRDKDNQITLDHPE